MTIVPGEPLVSVLNSDPNTPGIAMACNSGGGTAFCMEEIKELHSVAPHMGGHYEPVAGQTGQGGAPSSMEPKLETGNDISGLVTKKNPGIKAPST